MMFQVGARRLVRSVPGELSTDSNAVLALAQADGCVSQHRIIEVCAAVMLQLCSGSWPVWVK